MPFPAKETKPAHDPHDPDVLPLNPNVLGALRKPLSTSPSLVDHLEACDDNGGDEPAWCPRYKVSHG